MKDRFKDMMLFGLGSAVLAKEVVEDFVDEMIRSGKAHAEERVNLIEEFTERAGTIRADFESGLKQKVVDIAKDMNLVTRDEVDSLKAEIAELKEELASQTKKKK